MVHDLKIMMKENRIFEVLPRTPRLERANISRQ